MDHQYSDGVADISFVNGLVRVDFFRFAQGTDGEGDQRRPRSELSHRLVPSPGAFIQTQNALAQMTKRLADRGLIRPREAEGDGAAAKAEAKPARN